MTTLILTPLLLLPAPAPELQSPQPQLNIVQTAIAAGKFKTLATALGKAGLVEALSGKGPFTVFAPTDAAFAKLPKSTLAALLEPKNKAKLTAILTYHVVAGKVDATAAVKAGRAKTLQGDSIRVSISGGQLVINEAKVVANDVRATNGIIHIIDSVLLPPSAVQPQKLTPADAARQIIGDAISAGVPLFNSGQPAACVAIYKIAAFSVLSFGGGQLTEATQRALQKSIAAAKKAGGDTDKAWTLRAALDRALRDLMKPASKRTKSPSKRGLSRRTDDQTSTSLTSLAGKEQSTVNSTGSERKSLFAFDGNESTSWRSVNDDVMGGVSKGQIKIDSKAGTATFAGALSRRNNGGFSTVRSKSSALELGGYDGLVLRVKGDGRTYRVQALGGSSRWQMRIYQAEIKTTKGEWREIRVPFEEMNLSIRGRRFPGKTIDSSKIRSIGFSIADKNEAPFALEIDWIKAFREPSGDLAASQPRSGS